MTEAMKPQTLKQMAEDKDNPAVKKKTIYQMDPRLLQVEAGFNIRIDTPKYRASIQAMADAWKAGSDMPAIVVAKGTQTITDGHRRYFGAMLAIEQGHDILRVDVMEKEANEEQRLDYMLGSGEGIQYSTLEKGLAYLRYVAWGYSKEEIARRRNVSVTHVEQALKLATADRELQRLVAHELVTVSAALEAIREHGNKAGQYLKELSDNAPSEVSEGGEVRKKKVSRRTTNAARENAPRRMPAKLADRYARNVGELFASAPDLREKVALAGDDESIAVSARYLKELLDAHAEAEKLQATVAASSTDADPRQTSLLEAEAEPSPTRANDGQDEAPRVGLHPAAAWPFPRHKD